MKQCEWWNKGVIGCGSPILRGNVPYCRDICEGHQVNGEKIKDCPYYVDSKTYFSRPTGRKCPCCEIKSKNRNNYSYCISPKNPATNGGIQATQSNIISYQVCAEGRTQNGMSYTKCPYYSRMTKKQKDIIRDAKEKQRAENEELRDSLKLLKRLLWIVVAMWFFINFLK